MTLTILTLTTCAPCRRMAPVLKALAAEYGLTVQEIPFRSTAGQRLAKAHGVVMAPTGLLEHADGIVTVAQGLMTKEQARVKLGL